MTSRYLRDDLRELHVSTLRSSSEHGTSSGGD